MAKGLNLKATFSADTQPIKQGAKESAAAIKEFEGKAGSSIDAFASLFGTSMGQISGSVRAFQGGLLVMNKGFQTSAASSGALSKALSILKIALISTGIGAIVVALGSLVAYFKRSQDGADLLSKVLAPLKVLFSNLVDLSAAVGRAIVKAFQDPKQTIIDLWEALKKNIVNRIIGLIDVFKGLGEVIYKTLSLDWNGMNEGASKVNTALLQITTGLDKAQQKSIKEWGVAWGKEAGKRMSESQKLAEQEAALEKKKIAFIKSEADINERLTKVREQAADREQYSAQERWHF